MTSTPGLCARLIESLAVGIRIEKIDLPGIGVRHDVVTRDGRRVSVVTHYSGERELAFYDVDDPDSCSESVGLTDDEAQALADVLGASVMLSELAGLREQAAGLHTEQVPLRADSPYVNRPLGDTQARTRTGVSIVAVLREGEVTPSPGPEFVFSTGDTLVAVGTRSGLDSFAGLVADGPR